MDKFLKGKHLLYTRKTKLETNDAVILEKATGCFVSYTYLITL